MQQHIAWVSDEPTHVTHQASLPATCTCDWYADVALMLRAICDKNYTMICVHANQIQNKNTHHADLGAVIRTMCGISHDHAPHVVLIVDHQPQELDHTADLVTQWCHICDSERIQILQHF